MKILQINKYLKIVGGAETYMFELSKSLQEREIQVKHWGMFDDENIVEDFFGLEAEYIDYSNQGVFKKINSAAQTVYSNANRIKLAKVLDIYNPDIVHLHNYNFQLTPSILLEVKKRGIKVVQTIHDSQMVCPYHRLYNFQRNKVCTKCVSGSFVNCIKDRCFDGSLLKSTLGAFESYFYHSKGFYDKHIDAFISPSNFLASLIAKRISKKIHVIPNFTKVKSTPIKNRKGDYYLYYGRISKEKGVTELVDIFKETHLNLIIIGKGPLEEEIHNKVCDYDHIKFIGPKYGSDLFDFVINAKYVIQPSKWFENCPMTIIESFSLGVPVIGANHSGFIDLIEESVTGYLINFNNKVQAISKLLEIDKLTTEAIRRSVQDFYINNLSEEIHIEKVLAVYNNILDNHD